MSGICPEIDVYKTGQNIKRIIRLRGIKVREVQKYLNLSTPQSVYHWFKGKNMPSIDNLYALSELLRVPVDRLLCGSRKAEFHFCPCPCYRRASVYYEKYMERIAG